MLLPTSLVGSYTQPDWLIDKVKLAGRFPPRVRATELWRVDPEWREQAFDDPRDPRSGARRAGHHHRWRDAAGELFQPFCHRNGRR
jgi:hypothetical protein